MASGVFSAQLTSAALQAVSLTMLARFTDPQVFGRAGAVIAVATVLMAISDLGLGTLAVRAAARNPDDTEVLLIYRLTIALSILLSVISCAAVLVIVDLKPSYYEFAPLVAWMVIEKQLSVRSSVAVALRMVRVSTKSIIVSRITSVAMFCTMLLVDVPPTLAYTLGYLLGASAGLILVKRSMSSIQLMPADCAFPAVLKRVRPLIRRSAPFSVATLSYQVRTLDVALVSAISGPAVAGIYALPARLSAPLRLLPTALNSLAMPIVSNGNSEMLKQLTKLTRISWIVMITILGTLAVFSREIIVLLVGADYSDGATPMRILCLGIAINIVGASRSAMLQASGDERFIAKVGILVGIVSLGAVSVGAFWGGASGAAVGLLIAYTLQFIIISARQVVRVRVSV